MLTTIISSLAAFCAKNYTLHYNMKDPIEINSELKSGSQQNEKIKN